MRWRLISETGSDDRSASAMIPSILGMHSKVVLHLPLYRQYRQMLLMILVQFLVQEGKKEPLH